MQACSAPTLDRLLADPLIQAVMRADRVDPATLRRELTRVADDLATPSDPRARFGAAARATFVGPRLPPNLAGGQARMCG
jgi:hypothetical protein